MSFIVIGEILWDVFPTEKHIGGACFNVAAHLRQGGESVQFISAIGDDELGREALARTMELGLHPGFMAMTDEAPTGTVDVTLDNGQPDYVINRPAAYDFPALNAAQLDALRVGGPRCIYYGTLAQRSPATRRLTQDLIAAFPDAMRLYDINLRKDNDDPALVRELIADATAVKLNDQELEVLTPIFGLPTSDMVAACAALAEAVGLDAVCVTRGADGCLLWRDGETADVPGVPTTLADAVGAGDAFCSILARGLVHRDRSLAEIATRANRLGAYVASKSGAVPAWDASVLDG